MILYADYLKDYYLLPMFIQLSFRSQTITKNNQLLTVGSSSIVFFLGGGTNEYCIFHGGVFFLDIFVHYFCVIKNIDNICKVMNIGSYLDLRVPKIFRGKPT